MIIQIDLKQIIKYSLTPNQYVILYLLNEKEYNKIDELVTEIMGLRNSILILEEKGWLKRNGTKSEHIVLRDPAIKLFNITNKIFRINDVINWIEDWRLTLFPIGYKGDKHGCTTKMKAFVKDYPEFSKDEIYEATKAYVKETKTTPFLSQAHYFIRKDGVSKLAASCEKMRDGHLVNKQTKTIF